MDVKLSDPFYEEPPQKAFYYPSPERNLTRNERKTYLSPDHRSPVIQKVEPKPRQSPETEDFLTGGNQYKINSMSPGDDAVSSKLDESWPTSERPSTIGVPGDVVSPVSSNVQWQYLDYIPQKQSKEHAAEETQSTLEKYINRFRYGQPMSRQDRRKSDEKKDFWWLKPTPTPERSSTPIDDNSPVGKIAGRDRSGRVPLAPYDNNSPVLSKSRLPMSPVDAETRKLQRLADDLIEVSESALSSGPIVSTEGLGSASPSSAGGSSIDEAPYRPSFTKVTFEKQKLRPASDKENISEKAGSLTTNVLGKYPNLAKRSTAVEKKPHEDILQQWRMRRRLEVARQTPPTHNQLSRKPLVIPDSQLLTPTTRADFDNGCSPALKIDSKTPVQRSNATRLADPQPSTSQISENLEQSPPQIASPTLQRKSTDRVEPHLHLMCDLVPCPHQLKIGDKFEKTLPADLKHEENVATTTVKDNEVVIKKKPSYKTDANETSKNVEISSEESTVELTRSPRENLLKFMESNHDNIHPELCKLFLSIIKKDKKQSDTSKGEAEKHVTKQKSKQKKQKLKVVESIEGESTTDDQKSDNESKISSVRRDRKKSRKMPVTVPSKRKSETVKNTIDQVISDRLFSFSDDEPEPSKQPTKEARTLLSPKPSTSTQQPSEMKTSPDGGDHSEDEFPDDSMLQLLRKQRSVFEQKLRLIDTILDKDSSK